MRASPQGGSLAAEACATQEQERAAAGRVVAIDEARERAERISRSLEGRPHGDSAALIREDRGR